MTTNPTDSARAASDALHEKRYSLVTALCMIIGICIGSGIYFKADNVLIATGGSVALGVAMFCIASVVIVFGGLTLSVYAARSEAAGGLLSYADTYLPKPLARAFNWNFAILYLPVISAVLSWVVGVYFCMVFGLDGAFGEGNAFAVQMVFGLVFFLLCSLWNVFAPKLSGYFQNATTLVKMLPLVAVGVAGIAYGAMGEAGTVAGEAATDSASASGVGGLAWLAAAAPIAFSFDGWSMSTGIAPELRDSRRNLPRALVVAPLVVLALYLAYFVGLSTVLGPQTVMSAGDGSLGLFFSSLFGPGAAMLPNVIALVSVMGSVNGVVLSMLRMPYALAQRGDFPFAERVARVSPRVGFPVWSAVAGVAMTLAWMAVHVVATTGDLIPNGDISEVSVAFNMVLFCALFVRVPALRRGRVAGETGVAAAAAGSGSDAVAGEVDGAAAAAGSGSAAAAGSVDGAAGVDVFRGVVAPVLATVGSLFVGGSALMSPGRWEFVAVYLVLLAALFIWRRHSER